MDVVCGTTCDCPGLVGTWIVEDVKATFETGVEMLLGSFDGA